MPVTTVTAVAAPVVEINPVPATQEEPAKTDAPKKETTKMDPKVKKNAPGTPIPVTTDPKAIKPVNSTTKEPPCQQIKCPRNKWWEQFKIFYDQQLRADARAKIILERQRAYDAKLAARNALIAKRKEAADKRFFERDALNKLKA